MSSDPVIASFKACCAAHTRTRALCRQQQRLETELAVAIGFPHIQLSVPTLTTPVRVGSLREFNDLAKIYPSIGYMRDHVADDLDAHEARRRADDINVGYSVALLEEALSAADEERLMEALLATEPVSISGVITKLDALILIGEARGSDREFLWSQLRQMHRELVRMNLGAA